METYIYTAFSNAILLDWKTVKSKRHIYCVKRFVIFKNLFPLLPALCMTQYMHSKRHFISKRVG